MSAVTSLHEAAHSGDLDSLNRLLSEGADYNARDNEGRTPLMFAAFEGHEPVVRLLLKCGAEIDAEKPNGATALAVAVQEGQTAVVRLLLSRGAKTELFRRRDPAEEQTPEQEAELQEMMARYRAMMEEEGEEALAEFDAEMAELGLFEEEGEKSPRPISLIMAAIRSGNPHTLRALLEAGIEPGKTEETITSSPLEFATNFGDQEMVRLLLQFGADVNERQAFGNPLVNAVMKNDVPIARLLLEAGADPNHGMGGMPPLLFAGYQHKEEMVRLLLEFGATGTVEVEEVSVPLLESFAAVDPGVGELFKREMQTDWHDAVRTGDIGTVRARLDAEADVDAPGTDGGTALMLAALDGSPEMVGLLLERGANVHATSPYKVTALFWAASRGHLDVIRLLLAHGADINTRTRWKETPLYIAARNGHPIAVTLLREAGAPYNLPIAAACEDISAVEDFLRQGTPVDYAEEDGMTALMGASVRGNTALIERLLEQGASLNARDSHGETPIHYAVDSRQLDAVRLLLTRGADVNSKNDNGTPPVDSALYADRLPMLRLLLEHGAEVETEQVFGIIEVEKGMKQKFPDYDAAAILTTLFEGGVDTNLRDRNGQPLLYAAVRHRAPLEVLWTLIDHGADLNACIKRENTALQRAVEDGADEYVRLLLEAGADPNAGDSGITAYDIAVTRGDTEMAAMLAARGGRPSDRLQQHGFPPEHKQLMLSHHRPASEILEDSAESQPSGLSQILNFERKWDRLRREGIEPT
jgi:ankyrin repeat protein